MIEIIRDKKDIEKYFEVLNKRGSLNSGEYSDTVKAIVKDVALNGDLALLKYTQKFDNPDFSLENMEVSKEAQKHAFESLNSDIKREKLGNIRIQLVLSLVKRLHHLKELVFMYLVERQLIHQVF